ncbi:aromatic ring-hydroxylating dioxygenase subunit alpha, partial [Acinetobacter soli]
MTNSQNSIKLDPISDKELSQMFIKNAWYVACRPEDLHDKPLGR